MDNLIIHDWDDPDYYESLKGETDLTRWGWEFLRRNPSYQNDYKIFSEFPDFNSDGYDTKNGKYRGSPYLDGRFYIDMFHYTNPLAYKGESYNEYSIRCPDGEIMPYSHYLERKYHFQPTPLDPEKDLNDDIWFFFSDMNDDSVFGNDFPPWEIDVFPNYDQFTLPKYHDEYKERYINRMKNYGRQDGIVIFAFDYMDTIDKQLERVRLELQERKKIYQEDREGLSDFNETTLNVPNVTLKKFPNYIRMLDAKAAGVKQLAIGKALFPGDSMKSLASKISKNIGQAEEWSRVNYWKMGA